MDGYSIALAVTIFVLLYEIWLKEHIKLKLPFSSREYNFHYSCYEPGSPTYISFTKHANTDSLRKAIYEAVYLYRAKALIFGDFPPYSFPKDTFEPFFFEYLDFSNINYIDGRYPNLDTISYALPCASLVLPKNMKRFWFCSHCEHLKTLAIPSPELTHAYLDPAESNKTIQVQSGFEIRVPEKLLEEYRKDEKWSSLRFIDESGEEFHPSFLPYTHHF